MSEVSDRDFYYELLAKAIISILVRFYLILING